MQRTINISLTQARKELSSGFIDRVLEELYNDDYVTYITSGKVYIFSKTGSYIGIETIACQSRLDGERKLLVFMRHAALAFKPKDPSP